MKRTLLKLLNLGYLAACAISIWSICTKPVFSATLKLDMTPEKLGETLQPLLKSETGGSSSRAILRDGESQKTITDYITVERIADAFKDPDDPSKDGFHLELPVAVQAKYAFNLKNKGIIQEVVIDNINNVMDAACDTLSLPLSRFIFSITQEFAIDALETAINQQIINATGDDSPVSPQEVADIYNNVYDMLSQNEGSIPLSDLTDVIIHGSEEGGTSALSILNKFPRYDYEECHGITAEIYEANPDKYFIKNEAGKYVHPESYIEGATYYIQKYVPVEDLTAEDYAKAPSSYFIYDDGQDLYVNTETFDPEATYYTQQTKPYTEEDLDRIDIEGQMQSALSEVPGLVITDYISEKTVNEKLFNATIKSNKYYVFNGSSFAKAGPEDYTKTLFIETGENEYGPAPEDVSDFASTLESTKYYTLSGETFTPAKPPFNAETVYHTVTKEIFEASLKSSIYYVTYDGVVFDNATFADSDRNLYTKNDDGTLNAVTDPVSVEDFRATLVSNKYYEKLGDAYSFAKYPFSFEKEYFLEQASINDIDTALVALINQYLLKKDEVQSTDSGSSASRAQPLTNAKSREELKKALKEFAYKYIPMDKIEGVSGKFGTYVPYALLAIIALVGFPWALFALVTLIRTFKTKKCWTRPWIVIVLALPQLIFGFLLTYGTPYGLDLVAEKVEIVKKIMDSGITLELQSLCLVPSFVYLAIVFYSIIYVILAHDVKVEYKLAKRAYLLERYNKRRY